MQPLILKVDETFNLSEYLKTNHQKSAPSLISLITITSENKKSISIDQIRDLKKLLLLEGHFPRLVVFERFELCTIEAQNALLKLIEEEGSFHQFIFLTFNPQLILETIQSRCVFKNTISEEKSNTQTEAQETENLLRSVQKKDIKNVLSNQMFEVSNSEDAVRFLQNILLSLEKNIKNGDSDAVNLAKKTHEILKLITTYNTHAQLSLDLWLLRCVK